MFGPQTGCSLFDLAITGGQHPPPPPHHTPLTVCRPSTDRKVSQGAPLRGAEHSGGVPRKFNEIQGRPPFSLPLSPQPSVSLFVDVGGGQHTKILRLCLISMVVVVVVVMGGRGRWRGVTLTLRHSDLRVKTTGRKSHDPLKLGERRGESGVGRGQRRTRRGRGAERDLLRDLFFSLLFSSSRSDAGVCRYAWRLSRSGLQHQDLERQSQSEQQYTASFLCFYTQQNSSSCCC